MRRESGALERGTYRTIEAQLAALEQLDYRALRAAWLRCYQVEPPPRISRKLLLLGVGWKIQAQAFGGLSLATLRRLKQLAKTLKPGGETISTPSARLRPGSQLIREWQGRTYTVTVTEEGFYWKGKDWRSLSAIARAITGQRWSGPRFFGLRSARSSRALEPLDAG